MPKRNDASYYDADPEEEEGLAVIFGANVKRLREAQNINKQTFALMVGVGRPFLNEIESGRANPRLDVVERMAEALSTRPIELLLKHRYVKL